MRGQLLYLDSSALVKLVLAEAESAALLEFLIPWPVCVTSELAHVEVIRAARRASADPAVEQRAEQVMASFDILKITSEILARAARLEPRMLRSLDAVHLATALTLGGDLAAMVVYDAALGTAAASCGVNVMTPNRIGLQT